ncbi:MAG: zf-HC2 domain-containing protein [Chloroflexi bacterium]|nr:zf-HC2 domain-containing protein [Chloroflexota bacterium]
MLEFSGRRHRMVRGLLSPYIDGRLSQKDERLVDEHLSQCAECRRELEELRNTVQLLQRLPAVAPARSFAVSESQVRARSAETSGSPLGTLRLATAALVLLLALVVAGDLWRTSTPAPRQAAPSAVQASPAPAGAAESRAAQPPSSPEQGVSPQAEPRPQMGAAKGREPSATDQLVSPVPSPSPTLPQVTATITAGEVREAHHVLKDWPLRQIEFGLLGLLIVAGAAFVFLRRKTI